MILSHFAVDETVARLTKRGVELGGYDTTHDRGWFYKPLTMLLGENGVKASVTPYIAEQQLACALYSGRLFIASVNPEIIRGDTVVTNQVKSGHLVLVIGFKKVDGAVTGYYIHNPSGKSPSMQQRAFIPLETFRKSFGNRGVIIDSVL